PRRRAGPERASAASGEREGVPRNLERESGGGRAQMKANEQDSAPLKGRVEVLATLHGEPSTQLLGIPDADLGGGAQKTYALSEKRPGEPPRVAHVGLARRPSVRPAAPARPQQTLRQCAESKRPFCPRGRQHIETSKHRSAACR